MGQTFTRETLIAALERLGAELARRGTFLELAVYGGGALMLQFDWRRSTEDLDAVVRNGFDEAALAPAVQAVADALGLTPDWLNNAVGMFTPLDEEPSFFSLAGTYPSAGEPGLRLLLATPHYLLAMKLQALGNLERGTKDLTDARHLAAHIGLTDTEDLIALYQSVYDEAPPAAALQRLPEVVAR